MVVWWDTCAFYRQAEAVGGFNTNLKFNEAGKQSLWKGAKTT